MRLVLALLIGCANTDPTIASAPPCATRIDCPNEKVAPLDGACGEAAVDPECGATYQLYFKCRQEEQVCTGSGRLDEDASVARCGDELDAYVQCLGPVDTGADTAMDTTVVDTARPETAPDVRPDVVSDTKTDGG